jgi:hypothetical protein
MPLKKPIELLNESGQVQVKGWKTLAIGGSLIVDTICNEIRQSDFLIADVTTLNSNVLFELGFAIALGKRIWLLFDPSIAGAKADFELFQMFTTIGYARFSNSHDIVVSPSTNPHGLPSGSLSIPIQPHPKLSATSRSANQSSGSANRHSRNIGCDE